MCILSEAKMYIYNAHKYKEIIQCFVKTKRKKEKKAIIAIIILYFLLGNTINRINISFNSS